MDDRYNSCNRILDISKKIPNHSKMAANMSSSLNNTTEVQEEGFEEEESFIVVAVILMIYSIVGTIGNAIAFYIFFHRRDKSTSVIFILALAGCDFFTCLVIIPYTIVFEMLHSEVVYDVFCKLFMFLQTSNIPFSACIMVAIAFDRYFCICHPFLHAFTVSRAKITVVCLALMATTFGILTSLSFGVYRYEYRNISGYVNATDNYTDIPIIYASPMRNDTGGYVSQSLDNPVENLTYDYIASYEQVRVVHTGMCVHNQLIVSTEFMMGYQKVYTAVYIFSFVSVAVLYTLIYKSILLRRAKKAKRKKMSHYHSVAGADGTVVAETQMSTINGTTAAKTEPNNQNQAPAPAVTKGSVKRQSTLRDTNFYANIKTAAMLFVVTLVFIIAFLPCWLMAHSILPINLIVFYMYFTYNVVNPVIYAFMNQTFRDDLKKLINVCK